MITRIRKQLSGNTHRTFVIIFCLVLMGAFSLPALLKQDSVPWIFKVNGTKVTKNEFELSVQDQQERLRYFRAQYGQFADYILKSMGASSDPKELAKDDLVKRILLDDVVNAVGLRLSENFVIQQLHNPAFVHHSLSDVVPGFLFEADGTFNERALKMYLQGSNMSSAVFGRKLRDAATRQLLLDVVQSFVYVPEYEFLSSLKLHGASRRFTYATLSFDAFLNEVKQTTPSPETLKTFFDEQNSSVQKYWVAEQRDLEIWKFEADSYGILVTEKEIEEYYEKNKVVQFVERQATTTIRQIIYNDSVPGKPSIADLKDELQRDPSLFASKASQYSDDKVSAADGGLVKPFVRGTLDPAIELAAFALEQKGDVSEVIPTKKGFALIQLIEKSPRICKSLVQVRTAIEETLKTQIFVRRFSDDIKNLVGREGAVESLALTDFIKEHGPRRDVVMNKRLNQSDKISKKAFVLEKIGDGTLFADGTTGYAIILTGINPRYLPELETIRAEVTNDWHRKQALMQMNAKLQMTKLSLKTKSLAECAEGQLVTITKTGMIKRDDSTVFKKFESEGLPVGEMLDLEVPRTIALAFNERNAFIVQLDDIELAASDEKEALAVRHTAFIQGGRSIVDGMIAYLLKDAKMENNESVTLPFEDYLI
jgi:PPIC-type PPIASE domain/SurA N-terminal domain